MTAPASRGRAPRRARGRAQRRVRGTCRLGCACSPVAGVGGGVALDELLQRLRGVGARRCRRAGRGRPGWSCRRRRSSRRRGARASCSGPASARRSGWRRPRARSRGSIAVVPSCSGSSIVIFDRGLVVLGQVDRVDRADALARRSAPVAGTSWPPVWNRSLYWWPPPPPSSSTTTTAIATRTAATAAIRAGVEAPRSPRTFGKEDAGVAVARRSSPRLLLNAWASLALLTTPGVGKPIGTTGV